MSLLDDNLEQKMDEVNREVLISMISDFKRHYMSGAIDMGFGQWDARWTDQWYGGSPRNQQIQVSWNVWDEKHPNGYIIDCHQPALVIAGDMYPILTKLCGDDILFIRNWSESELPEYIKIVDHGTNRYETTFEAGRFYTSLAKPIIYLINCHPNLNISGFNCIHVKEKTWRGDY